MNWVAVSPESASLVHHHTDCCLDPCPSCPLVSGHVLEPRTAPGTGRPSPVLGSAEGKSPCPPDCFPSFGSILMSPPQNGFLPPEDVIQLFSHKLCPLSSWTHHNTCKIHLFSLFPQLQSCSMTVGITGLFFHPCHQHEARGWCSEASGQYLRGGGMNPDPPWATLSKSWLLRTSPAHPNQAVVTPISPETSLHPLQRILPHPPP